MIDDMLISRIGHFTDVFILEFSIIIFYHCSCSSIVQSRLDTVPRFVLYAE